MFLKNSIILKAFLSNLIYLLARKFQKKTVLKEVENYKFKITSAKLHPSLYLTTLFSSFSHKSILFPIIATTHSSEAHSFLKIKKLKKN